MNTWAFLIAQLVKIHLQCRRPRFGSWVRKISWRRDRLPTAVFLDFACGSAGKVSTCNVGDLGSIPGLERSPGEEEGYPLQYSGLYDSVDCIAHGVPKSRTRLSNFHFHYIHIVITGYSYPVKQTKMMFKLVFSLLSYSTTFPIKI